MTITTSSNINFMSFCVLTYSVDQQGFEYPNRPIKQYTHICV